MTWFKVDDRLAHHPKVMTAGLPAMGLWVRAGSWSAAHLTDGLVPASVLATFGAKRSHADALVKAGLWEVEPDGYRFRDWLVYQPSAHDVKLSKDAESEGGSFGNHKRWHANRGVVDAGCRFCSHPKPLSGDDRVPDKDPESGGESGRDESPVPSRPETEERPPWLAG